MQLFADNAVSTLQASINAAATTLTIDAGDATRFPVADTGTDPVGTLGEDWFKATLEDTAGNIEVVYIRTHASGDALLGDVIRGQDGTSAQSFAAGSVIEIRLTSQDVQDVLAGLFLNLLISGQFIAQGAAYCEPETPTPHSATPTIDARLSNTWEMPTMTGNVTVAITNAAAGMTLNIAFTQDSTGNRSVTMPAGTKTKGVVNTAANRTTWWRGQYSGQRSRWEGVWDDVEA